MRTDPGYDVDRNMVLRVDLDRDGEIRTSCEVYIAAGMVERLPELPWAIANLLNKATFHPQVEVPAYVRD